MPAGLQGLSPAPTLALGVLQSEILGASEAFPLLKISNNSKELVNALRCCLQTCDSLRLKIKNKSLYHQLP